MESQSARIQELEKELARLKAENAALKSSENFNRDSRKRPHDEITTDPVQEVGYQPLPPLPSVNQLSPGHIERYSRQLLLHDGFGVKGQRKLLSSSALVVGAGGIGSTVLMYLAASGIGHISILDFDSVEMSNLHRQIIHKEKHVGTNKAVSAYLALKELNPTINCQPLPIMLTHENALEIVKDHDCIVDASDNPRTRYLINDACALAGKPLISGSAINTEGQLSVYNWKGGPCYRCLYPKPSITAGAKSCSDNGVLGPVPGLIGVLQALEVLKILTETGYVANAFVFQNHLCSAHALDFLSNAMNDRLLMYDSLQCSFLTIKKPKKQADCPVCSEPTRAKILSMADSDKDLQSARGPATCGYVPAPLDEEFQISCPDFHKLQQPRPHVLLDVRVKEQFDLCSLDNAINIPLEKLNESIDQVETLTKGWTTPVYCICRRGVLSVEATKLLNEHIEGLDTGRKNPDVKVAKNIRGGLEAWRKLVDDKFPRY